MFVVIFNKIRLHIYKKKIFKTPRRLKSLSFFCMLRKCNYRCYSPKASHRRCSRQHCLSLFYIQFSLYSQGKRPLTSFEITESTMTKFYERLRTLLKDKGMSGKEFAEEMEVTTAKAGRWLT